MNEETRTYVELLRETSKLVEPAVKQAIEALELTPGSSGLDVGCGIGTDTIRLARAVAPGGRVTGLDPSDTFLDIAREAGEQSGVQDDIEFRQGSMQDLPFEDDGFDWLWCKDTFWPGPNSPLLGGKDPVTELGRLTRVVVHGGIVALLYWTTQALLPGYPELEARLFAVWTGTAPYTADVGPGQHFLNAVNYMRRAGLRNVRMQPFSAGVHAPLDAGQQRAVAATVDMFFGGLESRVSADDWAQYRALMQPGSDAYLIDRDDYCCVLTYCLFRGRVAH